MISHLESRVSLLLLLLGTPYWSQGAKKQFYVSKKCATKKECERVKQSNMGDCTYIWYQDWKCSDCCQGDKCNYYVMVSRTISRNVAHLNVNVTQIYIALPISVLSQESACHVVDHDWSLGVLGTQLIE